MPRGKREVGYTWTCLGSAAYPALQPLFLPLCRTGKADSEHNSGARALPTLSHKMRSWIQKCSMINKHSISTEPKWIFFPFPLLKGEGEKKKKSPSWLPFLDLQQIPLNFKNNALRCRRMQTGNWRLYTKVKNVFFGGGTTDKEGLYPDSESSWQLRT